MAVQTQFSTDPNAIVTVHVSIVEAPTPINYQRTGAFVSFGATTMVSGDTELLTQFSDLGQWLRIPQPVNSAAWAGGTVTVQTTSPIPNVTVGDTVKMVLSGFSPAPYNGLFTVTITANNGFTYGVATNPGAATTLGTYQFESSVELSQMATTYFGQGNEIAVWILELGYSGTIANKVIAFQNWLTQNPKTIYGFLMPREFGSDPAALPPWAGPPAAPPSITTWMNLLKQYQAPETMEYFWLTVTPNTMQTLGPTYKDVIQVVEAPSLTDPTQGNIASVNGEFTMAAMFYNALQFRPSNTNRIAPMAFRFLYGVTQYPQKNNGPLLVSFKSHNTNYVSTGAEGGIAFTMVYEGVTLDGHDYFNWWYTIDWVQIEINLNLSNAIINGSNNPLAPLYYNQDGINYLEVVLFDTMQSAQTFGMVLGKIEMTQLDGPDLTAAIYGGTFAAKCDVNAVPFLNYTLANPGDYKIGEYDGLSTLFIPARGFIHILVNVVASDLVSI
jgi:hypothetical protein